MTTAIYFAAPKPQLGQYTTLVQRLHDMVVGEEFSRNTPAIIAPTHWPQNTSALDIPFDIWQPLPSRHNFHSKYSPLVDYGYTRVHTASLFSPQDEILESSRDRFVTQPIGSRTPKPIIAPSTSGDPRPSILRYTTPQYKIRKANPSPIFLNEKVLWKLRSLKRGSQRLQFKHDRSRSYGSTTRRARILGQ